MPTDKLDQLFGVEEIKAQQQQVIAIIDDTVAHITAASKQMRASELFVTDSNSMAQGTAAIKAATTAVDAHKASLEKLLAVKQQEQTLADAIAAVTAQSSKNRKDETDGAAALATAIGALNKERERLAAQAAQEAANARNLNASYEQLKKQYKDASDNAKQLAAAQVLAGTATDGFNTKTKDAIGHAQNLGTQLNAAGAQVASYQSKVDACKGVSGQFNKMLGELPKLAQSPGEFIKALSGHIADFAEHVVKARSEGQSWGSILTAIGGSFTGLPGIINLAVTALGFFTNSMKQDEEQARRTKEALKGLGDSLAAMISKQSEINRIRGQANQVEGNTQKEEHKLELLKAQGAAISVINEQEKKVAAARVQDLEVEKGAYEYLSNTANEQYNFLLGKYKPEWARRELASSKELIDVIKQVTGVTEQEARKQAQLIASSINTSDTYVKAFNGRINQLKRDINQVNDDLEVTLAANNKLANNSKRTSVPKPTNNPKASVTNSSKHSVSLPGASDAHSETVPVYITPDIDGLQAKAHEKALKAIADANKQLYAADEQALIDSLKNKEISYAQYQESVSALNDKYGKKNLGDTIGYLREILGNEDMSASDRKKLQSQLDDARVMSTRDANEKIVEDSKAAQEKQAADMQSLQQIVGSVFDALDSIAKNKTDKDLARLQKQGDDINKQSDLEKQAVSNSILTQQEKDQRLADIDARTQQRQAGIAQQEAARKSRQANYEKGMAILKATIALYVGIAEEVEKGGVIGIGTGAAVAAYMATVISALAGTSTPQYAEGTDAHPGGPAIVGEKNKPEYVKEKGKPGYWVSQPTLIPDLSHGARVIPLHKMHLQDLPTMLSALPTLSPQYGDNTAAFNAGINRIVNAVNNKTETTIAVRYGEIVTVQKRAASRITYINHHNKR
ncbi:MAG: hypothetical protein BGO70_06840 [Bacteroidetes bacterium 43-93]|nr:hypothetical protein [Bacteroidota bacterium]OJW97498.1 MAG: hypothetical protein BGO70_06840 [Bacteroidetes bacterium 43-93]